MQATERRLKWITPPSFHKQPRYEMEGLRSSGGDGGGQRGGRWRGVESEKEKEESDKEGYANIQN